MASQDRSPPHPLIEQIQRDPSGYDFFRALRALECAYPDRPPIGHASRAEQEPVRFGQVPSLAFAPATFAAALRTVAEGSHPRLPVYFLGLLGPQGPLPLHITEYIRDRELNNSDATLSRFLDIFHHRIISLFYRAWAGSQQTVSHQRTDPSGRGLIGSDRFAFYIASLCGLGMESAEGRDAVPDVAKVHYAGHLSCQTRHAEGLTGVLSGYFGLPIAVEEFIGQWLPLDEDRRLLLGRTPATGTLGTTAIVGGRVWDRQQTFRLRVGPMDFESYQRLLPGAASLKRLIAWVRNYIGDELRFEIRLVLQGDAVPRTQLGRLGQLGWSTWLATGPVGREADDLILSPAF
jgi:type VI secretion system protein ImpH